jgi:hypothetical protein
MSNQIVQAVKINIEDEVRAVVEKYARLCADIDIHAIRVDGKFNYVTKKLEYGIYADVRGKGQIFLGMSS